MHSKSIIIRMLTHRLKRRCGVSVLLKSLMLDSGWFPEHYHKMRGNIIRLPFNTLFYTLVTLFLIVVNVNSKLIFRESTIKYTVLDSEHSTITCEDSRINILTAIENCDERMTSRTFDVRGLCNSKQICNFVFSCLSEKRKIHITYSCIGNTMYDIDDDEEHIVTHNPNMITTLGCGENRYLDIVEGLYGYGWHNGKEIKPMNVINDVKKRCQYQRDCSFNSMTLKKNVYKGEGNYFRTIFKCKPVTDKCYQINCGLNAHCITEDDSVMCRCDPGSIRENDKCVDTAVYEDYRHRPIKLARFKIPKQDDEEHDIMYEPHDHRANTLYEPEFGKIDKESGVLIVDRDDPELIDDDEDIVADKPVSGGTHNDENHPPHMHALTVDKTGVVIINPETMNNPTEQEGKKDTKQDGNNDTEQGSFTSNKISSENSSPDISHSADSVRNNVDENNRKIDADKKTSEVTPENTVSTSEDIVKEMGTTNGETGGQTVNNDPHVEEVQTTSEDNTPHGAMGNNIPKPHIPITPEDTTSLPPDIDKGLLHPSGGAINTTNHTSPLNSNQPSKDSANRESESGTANTDIKRRLVVPLENIDELGKNMQNRENAFGHQTLIGPHAQDGIESKRNKLQHPNKKSGILLIDNDTTTNAGDTFQSSVPKMGYCNGADTNKDCYTNRGNVNLSNGRVPILKNTDDSPTLPRPKLMGNTKMAHIMQHRENSSIYATPHTTVEYANQQTDSFICYIPTLFVASQPHSTDGRIEFETKQDDNNVRIYRYRYCISN